MIEPRTTPIAADDRVTVNGRPFIYTRTGTQPAAWTVHFPGGLSATVLRLRLDGHDVTTPELF